MAYILKSNTAVNDPDNTFDFYTRFGKTDGAIATYMSALELTGYVFSQSEFTALNTFVDALKDNLLWSKVAEIYPIMGNDTEGARIKLKSATGSNKMSIVDGFDDSMLEKLNGKVLGKNVTPVSSASNRPRLDTGMTVGQLKESAGFHFYCGNAQSSGGSLHQPLFGAAASVDGNTVNGVTQLAINLGTSQVSGSLSHSAIASTEAFTNTLSIIGYQAKVATAGVSSRGTYYKNGVNVRNIGPVNITPSDSDTTLAIFGRNAPYVTTSNGSTGYSGMVRFGCITVGYLDDAQVATLHSEINKLLISLGKIA